MNFFSRSGIYQNREYSIVNYNVNTNTRKGVLYPTNNGIFEVKYPDDDIIGKVV